MSFYYVQSDKVKFHAPPALWKNPNGGYSICGIQPMEPYTPERFEELKEEYHKRMEEHRQRLSQLKTETYQIASNKDPNKTYTVTHNKDGSWECTCPGFTYRRKCSHIEKAKSTKGK